MLGRVSPGVNYDLEERANALLREGRRGVTALSEKKDYFTEEQLMLRQSREVLNLNGVPDEAIFSGMYRRAYNPLSGKRPTRADCDDGW